MHLIRHEGLIEAAQLGEPQQPRWSGDKGCEQATASRQLLSCPGDIAAVLLDSLEQTGPSRGKGLLSYKSEKWR